MKELSTVYLGPSLVVGRVWMKMPRRAKKKSIRAT